MEDKELFLLAQAKDEEAFSALYAKNHGMLVYYYYEKAKIVDPDFLQMLRIAYANAILSYDTTRGTKFSTYLFWKFRGCYTKYTEKKAREISAMSLQSGRYTHIRGAEALKLIPRLDNTRKRKAIKIIVELLDQCGDLLADEDKALLLMRAYGKTYQEITDEIGGATRQRFEQKVYRAIAKLRRYVNRQKRACDLLEQQLQEFAGEAAKDIARGVYNLSEAC